MAIDVTSEEFLFKRESVVIDIDTVRNVLMKLAVDEGKLDTKYLTPDPKKPEEKVNLTFNVEGSNITAAKLFREWAEPAPGNNK